MEVAYITHNTTGRASVHAAAQVRLACWPAGYRLSDRRAPRAVAIAPLEQARVLARGQVLALCAASMPAPAAALAGMAPHQH